MSNRITTPVINYFDKAPSEKFHRLAWSCQLHHFLVPIKKNAPVNIFEETILKLIKEGVDSVEKLSQTTGLSKDFIGFIVQRLRSLELLDLYLSLTDSGNQAINALETIQVEGEPAVIGILVENITSKLLDIIVIDYSNHTLPVEKYSGDTVFVSIGSAGTAQTLNLKIVGNHTNSDNKNISTMDVKTIFRKFQKRLYSHKNPITAENSESANLTLHRSFEQVETVGQPLNVYLYCMAFFDKNSNFISVQDGFGYSLALTSALPKNISHYIKQKELMYEIKNEQRDATEEQVSQEKRRQREIKKDNILRELMASEEFFGKIENYYRNSTSNSTNKTKQKQSNERELFKSLYDAIEHTLAYVNHQRKFEEWGSFVKQSHKKNYANLIHIVLNELNFNNNEPMFRQLAKVTYGQVNSLSQGNVSLMPLLVKNIYASQNLENHPFSTLATVEPNLFNLLYRLKGLRNTVSHGEQFREMGFDEINSLYIRVKKVITFLYPKSVKIQVTSTQDMGNISQELLKAELRLDTHFSYTLPEMVRENLFRLFKLSYEEIELKGKSTEVVINADKLKYIRHLSASFEKTLQHKILQSIRQKSEILYHHNEFEQFLKDNHIQANRSLQKKLDALDSRKVKKLFETIHQLTLLDLLIVYLLLENAGQSQSLQLLHAQSVNIVSVAMQIHQLRGHNNAITAEFEQLSNADLIKLQQQVFLIINILTNFYDA